MDDQPRRQQPLTAKSEGEAPRGDQPKRSKSRSE